MPTELPNTSCAFIKELLSLTARYDFCSEIIWDETLEFYVLCSDFFGWGCADAEEIKAEDLNLLEQCFKDDKFSGELLYCARKRKMRPQNAYYEHLAKESWHLFDACGPEREVNMINPAKEILR